MSIIRTLTNISTLQKRRLPFPSLQGLHKICHSWPSAVSLLEYFVLLKLNKGLHLSSKGSFLYLTWYFNHSAKLINPFYPLSSPSLSVYGSTFSELVTQISPSCPSWSCLTIFTSTLLLIWTLMKGIQFSYFPVFRSFVFYVYPCLQTVLLKSLGSRP